MLLSTGPNYTSRPLALSQISQREAVAHTTVGKDGLVRIFVWWMIFGLASLCHPLVIANRYAGDYVYWGISRLEFRVSDLLSAVRWARQYGTTCVLCVCPGAEMPAASHVHSVSHPLKDMNTALKWDPLHTKSRETIACSFFLFFFSFWKQQLFKFYWINVCLLGLTFLIFHLPRGLFTLLAKLNC